MFSRFFTTFAPVKTENLHESTRLSNACAATIGCFDGVHCGHQLLIKKMQQEAQACGLESVVVTFDRLPRQLFDPDFRPQLLSTLREKESLLAAMGIDRLVVLPFTKPLAHLSAQTFMQQVLSEQLGVRVLVTGYDNRFGHNRSEGFDDYVRYGQQLDMAVVRGDVAFFHDSDEAVSSSAIRRCLLNGEVALAAEGLSRPYRLTGHVVQGEHIGHQLGFPTANLQPDDAEKLIPANGAYAVWAHVDGVRMPAMMNIGMRPTFQGTRQTLEVHILNPVGDVYGHPLTVGFVARLREERRFESQEALVDQLQQDRRQALAILQQ